MILQALCRYYEILTNDPESNIAPPGYSTIGFDFCLEISLEGKLKGILPLFTQEQFGKRLEQKKRRLVVPAAVKRSSAIAPNFLWDNAAYVLGVSEKDEDEPNYSQKRHEAFCSYNKEILGKADCGTAKAVIAFLNEYDPKKYLQEPILQQYIGELKKGGNLLFRVEGEYAHENPEIREIWEQENASADDDITGQCLVTGKIEPIARLHPSLKGISGANPTGASLVSFNDRAYESYNRTNAQGLNSPVSKRAAFAYTTALNYLLSTDNPNRKFVMGDTTVVYWAESDRKEYGLAIQCLFEPGSLEGIITEPIEQKNAENQLAATADKVKKARPVDISKIKEGLDEMTRFYVLGLAPNAARVAVRFFLQDAFGNFVERINHHYLDLQIDKQFHDQPDFISIPQILAEIIPKKARDAKLSPLLSGELLRAILLGLPYPEALYYAMINRIRAENDEKGSQKISYVRAAVIKASLMRKYRTNPKYQEVLTMSLNPESKNPAYLLGRLFAALEKVQQDAIGDANASIKDRFFTSACATPASVFPVLLRLSQHHIAKAEYGRYIDGLIEDILNLLDINQNPIPTHLNLDEQGIFILGYYHQRANFYLSKGEREKMQENQ